MAPLELVDQPARLAPVGGRDEADASAVGELFEVVELAVGYGVVGGHRRAPFVGAGWSRKPRPVESGVTRPQDALDPSGLTPGEQSAHWLRLQHPQRGDGRNGHLASSGFIRLTRSVRLFALVDESLVEPIEVYWRRKDAERALAELLRDEPDWWDLVRIEEFDLGEPCWN